MTAHKHAEMIKAKADNMELVVFIKRDDSHEWSMMHDSWGICFLVGDNSYQFFLCLPQHKEACLHWLNGEEVQYKNSIGDFYDEIGMYYEWNSGCSWMCSTQEFRIKLRKEKRYLMVQEDGACTSHFSSKEQALDCIAHTDNRWQLVEIEVEV